jgi:MraZ protein
MFRGSSEHSIDDKGRIIIPARFRPVIQSALCDGMMVTYMDGCLMAYTLDEWLAIEQRVAARAENSSALRRFRRVFIGGAQKCTFDRQWRMLIPPLLRKMAELEKEITLVGVLKHFEIWSQENYAKEYERMDEDMQNEEVSNEIASLGI